MALTNMGFKTNLVSKKRREKRRERGEEQKERRRRRREEEEEGRNQASQDQEVWNFGFCMELTLVWIIWNLYGILEKFMSSKPRVFLGFHLNPKIMGSKVGKTPYDTRLLENPSF